MFAVCKPKGKLCELIDKLWQIQCSLIPLKLICSWTVSKERPGSIETKTLKKGILIPIDTSKEYNSYADFKYISFIKFSLTHQKSSAWENLSYFQEKGETHPKSHKKLMKITPSDSA
jgi:hypothetical protein